jgi:DNA-binding NtrC family response regulator
MSPKPYRICLVDDDQFMGEALSERFEMEGFECDWFKTGRSALQALSRKRYSISICDIQLPDIDGEELYVELSSLKNVSLPPFVFITGYATVDRAVRLLKLGAHDYLTKPLDIHNLLKTIRETCAKSAPPSVGNHQLGISSAMRSIEAVLPRLAQNATSILITGESGVGKEWVARALHNELDPSGRSPFIAVNCGALTESLLEAELFGHVKGAYTGAVRDRKGVFELANGGMLFLDEIGEMSPTMQVKLLRAIQERQIVPVGGEVPIPVNITLVCATHRDMKNMVELGTFREDLYYRIHVVHLHVPPLRERKEDIPWLAERLLAAWGAEKSDKRTLDAAAKRALLNYPWPGNIRELKHCLERACILSGNHVISPKELFGDELPSAPTDQTPGIEPLNEHLNHCERKHIESSLRSNNGRIIETASALGISRKSLWEKMKKLQIEGK